MTELAIILFEKIKEETDISESCSGNVIAVRIQKNSKFISFTDGYVLGAYVNDEYKRHPCVNLRQLTDSDLKSITRELQF